MKDINFFSPYIGKRKIEFNNKFFLAMLFLIFSISIIGYGVINQLQINKLSEKNLEFQKVAEDPEVLKKVEAIRKEEEELRRSEAEIQSIKLLKDSLEEKDFIGSDYIEKIINRRPDDLFFTSLNITSESINMTGISNNRLSIAEFTKGLKTIDRFENLFVTDIIKEETDYKFELESNFIEEEGEDVSDEEEIQGEESKEDNEEN